VTPVWNHIRLHFAVVAGLGEAKIDAVAAVSHIRASTCFDTIIAAMTPEDVRTAVSNDDVIALRPHDVF